LTSDIRVQVRIAEEAHVVLARSEALRMARALGFSPADEATVALITLEVANNIFRHAGQGSVNLAVVRRDGQQGISIVASDDGPGIIDVALAMQDGYSTDGGVGGGLPAVKRLADEFEIESGPGRGTVVRLKKWRAA
jgi:serine/threonine-protein kinase RsbT